MLKIFKLVAVLEGISYLALFGNMLFIKHNNPELYQTLLFPIGMAHGLLFIAYIILAIMLKDQMKWSGKDFFLILVASVIPFGTFWVEKKYLSK
ncbi:MAG: DUF3817 domain-containing protein [Flavobacteriaceae bacterium]